MYLFYFIHQVSRGANIKNKSFKKDRQKDPNDKRKPIRKDDRNRDEPRRKFRDDKGPRPVRYNKR